MNEYFWPDLWLKIWWILDKIPLLGIVFWFITLWVIFDIGIYDVNIIVRGIISVICLLLTIAFLFAPRIYPWVYSNSPETPLKQELRQKSISEGSQVWIIQRNESGIPIALDEHTVFVKTSSSIIVDAVTKNDSTGIALKSYPIADCFSDKSEAISFLVHTEQLKELEEH